MAGWGTLPKLKLIIDKNTKQLLFAEANKDFVDLLFDIPSLPIASFLNLSQTDEQNRIIPEGSLGTLYNTIKNMDSSHFNMINTRETLIGRANSAYSILHECGDHVQAGKYMVMDDLTVEPMSAVTLLNRLNELGGYGSDVNKLEEKEVLVGKLEVDRLLKESLVTKKVLSTVFLGEKYKDDNEDANERQDDYVFVGGQRPIVVDKPFPPFDVLSGYQDHAYHYHPATIAHRSKGLYGNRTSQPSQPTSTFE